MALIRLASLVTAAVLSACAPATASSPPAAAPVAAAQSPQPVAAAAVSPLALTPASSVAQPLSWTKAPPAYPAGAEIVVIEGDTSKPGPFTLRLRFPDGYAIAPHSHPFDEHVTVIEGTFMIGMGVVAKRDSAQVMPAGSFVLIPSRTEHYLFMKGVTVVQAHGIGPAALIYVNPSDDPRNGPPPVNRIAPNGPSDPVITP